MDHDKKQITEILQKNQEIISFFEKDADFIFAYKKTEKLASALYMVTNLFPDSEPMKWTLRKKVSDLLSFILGYKDVTGSALSDFIYIVKTNVLEIVSLLEVSMLGSLVSPMNFNILKTEFSNLLDVLSSETSKSKESSGTLISSTFFDMPLHEFKSHTREASTITSPKMSFSHIKDEHGEKDHFKRTNRQNIILGLIKKKKEVTIKDISLVIKDCSEKTIQRELISFIEAGVLKRTGERRWSKYSLI